MTTKTSDSQLLDLHEQERGSLPTRVCECGARCMLTINKGVITRYSSCQKCMTQDKWSEFERFGYLIPTAHPLVPRAFLDTDESKLPPTMRMALEWMPTKAKSGMLLHGTSGIGKSRTAWKWVNDHWFKGLSQNLNLNFKFLSMMEAEEHLTASFSDNKHSAALKALCKIPLLVLDDLGKERMTSRMATDLFAIIDQRSLNVLPTIITTNFNGQGLIDRFQSQDKETGIAMVRRLRDYYTPYGMQPSS